jgi:flagellar basal body L-ring protein FlgH
MPKKTNFATKKSAACHVTALSVRRGEEKQICFGYYVNYTKSETRNMSKKKGPAEPLAKSADKHVLYQEVRALFIGDTSCIILNAWTPNIY